MTDTELALRRRRLTRVALSAAVVVAVLIAGWIAEDEGTGGSSPSEKPGRPDVACGAEVPETHEPMRFPSPAPSLRPGVDYAATIRTSCGDLTVDLLEDEAPESVNSFVFLARQGFYDGLRWVRIEPNSVIQTGDPNNDLGTPPDDAGYTIPDELPERPNEYTYGAVALANEGRPDSSGSSFFIVIHENRPAGYQLAYSLFGRVDASSFDVLKELGTQPTKGGDIALEAVRPSVPVYVESIEILER